MLTFLHRILAPTAIFLLFIMVYALSVHIAPSVPTRTGSSLFWLLVWILIAVLAFVAWLFLVAQ